MDQVPAEGEVAQLKTLPMPTLILWGGQDRLIPPETARRFDAAGWEYRVHSSSVPPEELVAMKLNALILDPSVIGPLGTPTLGTVQLSARRVAATPRPCACAPRCHHERSTEQNRASWGVLDAMV
jgi:hypothetical protein